MSQVWRAQHASTLVPVAVKVMTESIATEPRYQAMFASEVRATARLRHPSVALVLDHGLIPDDTASRVAGLAPGCPYLVTEFASGGSLAGGDIQPWPELRKILLCLLEALSHAHARGVIHRDVKPGNLLLCTEGDVRPGWKLADFGIAVFAQELREETGIIGTLRYMAPEQMTGNIHLTGPWTDLYSVGVLTWRLACGIPPFRGTTGLQAARKKLSQIAPPLPQIQGYPAGLKKWVARLLERDPTRRFRCAADAHWALSTLETEGWDGPPPMPETWRRTTPRPLPVKLVGAGLGVYGLRALPIVGRLEGRDRLWEMLHAVRKTRRPKVVLIRGTQGVGKNCLASWLCERAEEVGAAMTWRAGEDGPEQMLRNALRVRGETRLELRELVTRQVGQWGGTEPDIDVAQQLIDPSSGAAILSSPTQRHGALARLLQLSTRSRPVVIRVDNAHTSLDCLRFCAAVLDTPGDLPVLMVATVRDEALVDTPVASTLLENLAADSDTETLQLLPLDQDERHTLVRELLGLSPALASRVEERTSGNPLFAIQLVGEWIQGDLLVLGSDGFKLRPDAEEALPSDLVEVWSQRIDLLLAGKAPEAASALECAAALGVRVDTDEWAACTPELSDPSRQALLGEMLRQRLAAEDERGWSFAHGMLREILLARSRDADRLTKRHLTIAAYLSKGQPTATRAHRVGRHLLAGGRPKEACAPLLDSWLREQRTITTEEMAARLDTIRTAMALAELPERHVLYVELARGEARWLQRTGRMEESGHAIDHAVELATRYGHEQLEDGLLADQVVKERMKPQGGRGRALAQHMIATGDGGPRELTGWCLLGWLSIDAGDPSTAAEEGRRSLALAERTGEASLLWSAQELCGMAAFNSGRPDEAQSYFEATLSAAQDLRDPYLIGRTLTNLGEVARLRGDLDLADQRYLEAIKNWTALGAADVATAWLNVGLVGVARRDFAAARRGSEAFKLLAHKLPRNWYWSISHALDAALNAGLDDVASAAFHAAEVSRLIDEHGRITVDQAWALGIAADLLAQHGHRDQAHDTYATARDLWRRMGRADEVARIDEKLLRGTE